MSRTVQWSRDHVCDRCGKKGAHDFMGDYFCDDCLEEDEDGNTKVKDGKPDAS